MPRIFIGTFLDPEQQEDLGCLTEAASKQLKQNWHGKISCVKPIKLHMTWLFLGEHNQETICEIANILDETIKSKSTMSLTYKQLEFWPNLKTARLLVLLPESVPKDVKELGVELRKKLGQYASQRDIEQFRPHVTLMRFARNKSENLILPSGFDKPINHVISTVSLIESTRHLDQYVTLQNFKL